MSFEPSSMFFTEYWALVLKKKKMKVKNVYGHYYTGNGKFGECRERERGSERKKNYFPSQSVLPSGVMETLDRISSFFVESSGVSSNRRRGQGSGNKIKEKWDTNG